jgi:hypothetical protein
MQQLFEQEVESTPSNHNSFAEYGQAQVQNKYNLRSKAVATNQDPPLQSQVGHTYHT